MRLDALLPGAILQPTKIQLAENLIEHPRETAALPNQPVSLTVTRALAFAVPDLELAPLLLQGGHFRQERARTEPRGEPSRIARACPAERAEQTR